MKHQRLIELLAYGGQLDLLAEKLQSDPVELLHELMNQRDDDSADVIKFVMVTGAYSLLHQVDQALAIQLDDMSPGELAKFRMALAGSIQSMMASAPAETPQDDDNVDDPKSRLILRLDELADRRALGTGTNGHGE